MPASGIMDAAGGSVWRWGWRERRTHLLGLVLLILALLFAGGQIVTDWREHLYRGCDFFGLWSFAQFAHGPAPARIYDLDVLAAFERHLDPGNLFFPYRYPPPFLLILYPLGFLGFGAAYLLWTGGSLAGFLIACLAGRKTWEKLVLGLALLAAPATTINAAFGQGGFLAAALLIGAFRLLPRRPVLAGMLLGVLACKPQLGLVVPVALIAAGAWRCVFAAAGSFLLLCLATLALFGWPIWQDWLHAAPALVQQYHQGMRSEDLLMPSVAANLRVMGLGASWPLCGQAVAAVAACTGIWCVFRRGPDPLAIPALLLATFLVTPFAFRYDLVIAAAGAIFFARAQFAARGGLTTPEALLIILCLLLPVLLVPRSGTMPVSLLVLGGLFAVMVRAALRAQPGWGMVLPASAARQRYQAAVER